MVFCGVLWCCAVLCFVVFCGAVRCCVVFCGAVRCCVVFCGAVRCCMVLCGVLWYCAVLCCVLWCFVVLCGAVRCCVVFCGAVPCCVVFCGAVRCCVVFCGAVRCCVVFCYVICCCAVLHGVVPPAYNLLSSSQHHVSIYKQCAAILYFSLHTTSRYIGALSSLVLCGLQQACNCLSASDQGLMYFSYTPSYAVQLILRRVAALLGVFLGGVKIFMGCIFSPL